jgi:hypothetical protein
VHQELVEAEIPDVVGAREAGEGAGEDGGAGVAPGAIGSSEAIASVACDDELMALLGIGKGIGTTGMAKAAGGSAIEPTEGRQIGQIRER